MASPGVMCRVSDFSRATGFPSRARFASICRLSLAMGFSFIAVPLFYAQEPTAITVSQQVKDLFRRMANAVVKIHGVDEHCEIAGTGFFIDPTGTLYTAYTVGGEADNFTIEFNGKKYPARQLLAYR